jgi:hypothetical protein
MSANISQTIIDHELNGRSYLFSRDAWPTNRHVNRPPRDTSTRRRSPYRVSDPCNFAMPEFATAENLKAAFHIQKKEGGHGAGLDGLKYSDFSNGEIYRNLRQVARAILDGSYMPYGVRVVPIRKPSGGIRELRLKTIIDRTVAKALQLALSNYWRGVLPGLQLDVWRTLALIERVMLDRSYRVLATDDVRNAFPSARIDDVIADHRQHIQQPELLRLIESVIRGQDGRARTTGLEQGCPYSPTAMELRFHNALDRQLIATDPDHPLPLRYVDNLNVVCGSVPVGRQTLNRFAELLAPHGFELKGEDGDPVDVRAQDSSHVVLGLIPRWHSGHLGFRVPDSAYSDLAEGLLKAHQKRHPVCTAKRVITGWLRWLGPVYVDTDVSSIVSRVLRDAARLGFREICGNALHGVARDSRDRWLVLRDVVRRNGG